MRLRLAVAALLGLYMTYEGEIRAVYQAQRGHWLVFSVALVPTVFFAVCSSFLIWRFANRFAKPSY